MRRFFVQSSRTQVHISYPFSNSYASQGKQCKVLTCIYRESSNSTDVGSKENLTFGGRGKSEKLNLTTWRTVISELVLKEDPLYLFVSSGYMKTGENINK